MGDYSKELGDTVKPNPSQERTIENENTQTIGNIKRKKDEAVRATIETLGETYGPDKHYNDAAYYYSLLPRSIINTPTGQRLVKLAARKKFYLDKRT